MVVVVGGSGSGSTIILTSVGYESYFVVAVLTSSAIVSAST